ncbi:glycoside hydrolase family 13 protein [Arthrobacter sp.]|uniref:glycoside hydrolase family 13 protein n=1 Tax=Arthrobacter sp. TaxID=1667 RepID=UPI003A8FF071
MTDTLTDPRDRPATGDPGSWWRQAAVYQIYPRSFADANGDGIGDLAGITERIGYLRDLGIDAVWLSPFYPSALADGGYDVDDYRDVDPRLGTLADFDSMTSALHAANIKLIVDIVPNHTSDRHEWFREALASPRGSSARNRYIFRDGLGVDGSLPPADWVSAFGGPAWEPVGDGQWYLHYFATEQPDLNWKNPEVREDFLKTLRFWSDRGVDGFRVDVAHGCAKELPEVLPSQAELDALDATTGQHPLWDRDEVHEIYAEWRSVFNEYSPPRTAVAEAWVATPDRRHRYASIDGLGQAFNFDLLEADFDAASFRGIITSNLAQSARTGSSTTWVFSNHDVVRHATRYALPPRGSSTEKQGASWLLTGGTAPVLDIEGGLRRARAATLLMLGLPGSAYLYQGEELGLQEVADIPDAERQDPSFFRNPGVDVGRDGCRVPLPWKRSGPSFGFGATGAHLPQPGWFSDFSVEAEEDDTTSTLAFYRQALALRKDLQTVESLEWIDSDETVLHYVRPGGWSVVANFGTRDAPLPAGEVLIASSPVGEGRLPSETAVWLKTPSAQEL